MTNKKIHSLFKKGSKTYFYSTLFFPKPVKEDVSILYAFVRKADDFVDSIPQRADDFYSFRSGYEMALSGKPSGDVVIDTFVDLLERKDMCPDWVDAFFESMEADIYKSRYETLEELEVYLYGSSEVVGLMMAKIMGLSERSYVAARYLGKAMQYINFIRDVEEDIRLGRSYLPGDGMRKHGLESLEYEHVVDRPESYRAFIEDQIDVYRSWMKTAETGYRYIPMRYLVPIKTASDMYMWTAERILWDPFTVYRGKVKPSLYRIVCRGISNAMKLRDWGRDIPGFHGVPAIS